MESTISLFKGLVVKTKETKEPSQELVQFTVQRGFIFSPQVCGNYTEGTLFSIAKDIGLSSENMNAAFHKSWKKIEEAELIQLVMEQMIHYITTYGFERLGCYQESSVYVPLEKLEIPEVTNIPLTIIRGYTKEELKNKVMSLLNSGIALKEETKTAAVDVCLIVKINQEDLEAVKNKEVRCLFYELLNIIPSNPTEFLRFLVYKVTGETLLIKSTDLMTKIKEGKILFAISLFHKYEEKFGLNRLAEIFYRFKPLFLALRTNPETKRVVNKIRRLAVENHKPMPQDYLNDVTMNISHRNLSLDKLEKELTHKNIFRKIRLAYALNYRTKDVESILYKIRNGKSWATEFSFDNKEMAQEALEITTRSIAGDISVKGKKIYLPEEVVYSLPATEKQFTGNFPSGTYVKIPEDLVFGIHWKNVADNRIDLDLSLLGKEKYGWDALYRAEDRGILFSGDMTTAPEPKGASELFYIKQKIEGIWLVFVNYYNFDSELEVPFKVFVAKEEISDLHKNYMINPNNVVCSSDSVMKERQKLLGFILNKKGEQKFYFCETYLGRTITSSGNKNTENTRKYFIDFYKETMDLKSILLLAGANLVSKEECDIDLSPEKLERDTFINLLVNI